MWRQIYFVLFWIWVSLNMSVTCGSCKQALQCYHVAIFAEQFTLSRSQHSKRTLEEHKGGKEGRFYCSNQKEKYFFSIKGLVTPKIMKLRELFYRYYFLTCITLQFWHSDLSDRTLKLLFVSLPFFVTLICVGCRSFFHSYSSSPEMDITTHYYVEHLMLKFPGAPNSFQWYVCSLDT